MQGVTCARGQSPTDGQGRTRASTRKKRAHGTDADTGAGRQVCRVDSTRGRGQNSDGPSMDGVCGWAVSSGGVAGGCMRKGRTAVAHVSLAARSTAPKGPDEGGVGGKGPGPYSLRLLRPTHSEGGLGVQLVDAHCGQLLQRLLFSHQNWCSSSSSFFTSSFQDIYLNFLCEPPSLLCPYQIASDPRVWQPSSQHLRHPATQCRRPYRDFQAI